MACLVVADRPQEAHVLEAARGALAIRLQHGEHVLAGLADLSRMRPDDMARHNRRRGLPQGAGLDVMSEVGDDIAIHLQPDPHLRPAELGMRRSFGIGIGQHSDAGNVAGEFENPAIVNVVHHLTRSD